MPETTTPPTLPETLSRLARRRRLAALDAESHHLRVLSEYGRGSPEAEASDADRAARWQAVAGIGELIERLEREREGVLT